MPADNILRMANRLAEAKQPFAMATVVRVEGSSSARPGSKAIVDARGQIVAGWVGGGCAESTVRRCALQCLKSGQPQLITLDMMDEVWGVGMPCGGIMDVYVEPVLAKPELLIVGHGRIAESLAKIGGLLDFEVVVDDPGAEPAAFPDADRLITDDFDLSVPAIGPATFVVIATQHKGDHLFLRRALAGEAAYIALIASRHRAALVLDYLASMGTPASALERIWAPAGLDIGAATPGEIALSVMTQIVTLRRSGSAQPLKYKPAEDRENKGPVIVRECDLGIAG